MDSWYTPFLYVPEIGQIREYTLFLSFFLPRSGFVQQRLSVGLGSLAAEAGRSIKAMIKIYPFTFLFIFLVLGCENNPPDNVYRATEIDSLSFLLKNSDLIALVKISDGMPTTDKPAKKFKEVVAAEIVESFYGDIEDNDIKILNTPVHTTPGIVEHQLYFSNGEFIYFLKKFEGSYKPLTPFSAVRIRNGKGAPIWKLDKAGSMPEINKGEIIKEIKESIEQMR